MEKITYASLASLDETFHSDFETALHRVRQRIDRGYPLYLNGQWVKKRSAFKNFNPAESAQLLGRFSSGEVVDVARAIAAARNAFSAWRDLNWKERVQHLRRAAELMTQRQFELAAILTLEVGKNRFEAIAEVSESIELILYYAQQLEQNEGFEVSLVKKGREQTKSVLKPYGVWAVVSPFNFPLALATGMAAGALLAGNTVVFKPSSDTPWSGVCLAEIFHEAGLPSGTFNCITGSGAVVGSALLNSGDLDGFVFTGSKEIGFKILTEFRKQHQRPVIAEMGGKNPAIVMPSANLDDAAEGVVRSAFGMGGQKCSACSRVYVHEKIYGDFMQLLVNKTSKLKIGDPAEKDTFLGPLINKSAIKRYDRAVRLGKAEGRLVYGGGALKGKEFKHGFFVSPVIFDKLPQDSKMFQEEFFAPVLPIAKVRSLDEAVRLANKSEYGLTAGIFTNDPGEQKQFFNQIEAGVTYCNRRGGATTGAWPGVQSFGGWGASGSSGKSALGPYYVSQFMREQSQTIVSK
ncbi:MAG: aldehyde dehydrogenase family protein [Verrucomicrobia bacterium]|nr:aldehyde dehydrogenase family protein [Verrucomicrobiota bacterium]